MSLEESATEAVCGSKGIIDVPLRRPKPVPSCQFDMSVSFGHGTYLEESKPRCNHGVFNVTFTGGSSCYGKVAGVRRRCVCWPREDGGDGVRVWWVWWTQGAETTRWTGNGPASNCDTTTAPDVCKWIPAPAIVSSAVLQSAALQT
ncbi:hypothetical protein IG631_01235 [Alternaria alternata]|nr:hypothetical protein IG631_01235 [Alternaria alternata]